jgi:NAD(P)-dependent dehydrogenase (short-subunit alcohol dehydrogenase family)
MDDRRGLGRRRLKGKMMGKLDGQIWLITGASSGLGRAQAERVLAEGGSLVATGRNAAALAELAAIAPDRVEAVAGDLTDPADVARIVAAGVTRFGRVDVLVNAAGYGLLGVVEECSLAEIRKQFDVNLFGAIAVIQAALPVMRQAGSGLIINFSSIAGMLGFAGSGIYCCSKWALEGLSESLSVELAPFGIGVLLVEPGPFRTDFAGRSISLSATQIDAYESSAATRAYSASMDGRQEGDPVRAADLIIDAVCDRDRPQRLILGATAFDAVHQGMQARVADVERSRAIAPRADFPA